MLKPGQGMIHRLKCELVYTLALSKSRSASWWCPRAESMMELLSVAETRMVVGGGRRCGGSCCLGEKAWKKCHERRGNCDLGREEKKKRSGAGHIGMKEVGDMRWVSESQPIPLCSLKIPVVRHDGQRSAWGRGGGAGRRGFEGRDGVQRKAGGGGMCNMGALMWTSCGNLTLQE